MKRAFAWMMLLAIAGSIVAGCSGGSTEEKPADGAAAGAEKPAAPEGEAK